MPDNRLQTIDDVIKMMDERFSAIQTDIREMGVDQRVGELISQAQNPDEVFKSGIIMNCLEQLFRVALQISYLNQPVVKTGVLRQMFQGRVELDGETIPDGTRMEYFSGGSWFYGTLHRNKATGQNTMLNWEGNVMLEQIDGVQARLRGKSDE